jgi:hypothetical protein
MADRRSWLASAPTSKRGWLLGFLLTLTATLLAPCVVQAASLTVGRVVPRVSVVRDGQFLDATSEMPLQDGDQLMGAHRLAIVEVNCPGGGVHLLSGTFDAIIRPVAPATPNAKAKCVVELRRGIGVATTAPGDADEEAEMRSGPIAMTSHHTQFGMSLDDTTPLVGFVLDGSASCTDGQGKRWTIDSGRQLDLRSRQKSTIDPKSLQLMASAFTRADLSQSKDVDGATQIHLQSSWLAVLSNPSDARARVELAEAQNKAQIRASRLSTYQRARAGTLASQSADPALVERAKQLSIVTKSTVPH